MRIASLVLLQLLALPLAACRSFGGGEDEAMTVNTVNRTYDKAPEEVWKAVESTLKDLELRVEKNQVDALGGVIRAERANRDRIYIEARSVDASQTQLSVAVGPGDRTMAQIIQDRVASKLGTPAGVVRSAFAAGSRLQATYDHRLDECTNAAQRAMESLKITGIRAETHDTWSRVDGRYADAIPARIGTERTPKDQTQVTFTAGTSASDDNHVLASRLKAEFERFLKQANP